MAFVAFVALTDGAPKNDEAEIPIPPPAAVAGGADAGAEPVMFPYSFVL